MIKSVIKSFAIMLFWIVGYNIFSVYLFKNTFDIKGSIVLLLIGTIFNYLTSNIRKN